MALKVTAQMLAELEEGEGGPKCPWDPSKTQESPHIHKPLYVSIFLICFFLHSIVS